MYEFKRLSKVFEEAEQIPVDDSSRIIMLSDCHRGDGSWADDFSRNQAIYYAALTHYYIENYTYIELGDGDELWKNRNFTDIIQQHEDTFRLISRFIKADRFYCLYGNHDISKKTDGFDMGNDLRRLEKRSIKSLALFKNMKVHEGLILWHKGTGGKILLVHGHQGDYFNDRLWRISRFLVRYLWRPLELLGVNDPTSPAKNNRKMDAIERKLIGWVKSEKQMVIAGHTHRPVFPEAGEIPYFNDGSCVHPRSITGIEIANGNITLVKWSVKSKADGTLTVDRDIIGGPAKLADYFGPGI